MKETKIITKNIMHPIDKKIIDNFKEIFFKATGLGISFLFGNETYNFYPKNKKNKYCQLVQSIFGVNLCRESDGKGLQTACENGEYCIYHCHAGLVNVAVPLTFQGKVIGGIYTGQIVTDIDESKKYIKELTSSFNLNDQQQKQLHRSFKTVKHFDIDKLLFAIRVIMFMSNYLITLENEKCLLDDVHKKEQQILRYENESIKLKNNLQSLSIQVLKDKGYKTNSSDKNGSSYGQQKQIVKRAQELINRNFSQPLTCSKVAEAVYLSPNYFGKIFRKVTDKSFNNYLNEVRTNESKRILMETDIPVKLIYPMVGFSDYNYFNRVFSKYIGTPPATFRRLVAEMRNLDENSSDNQPAQ